MFKFFMMLFCAGWLLLASASAHSLPDDPKKAKKEAAKARQAEKKKAIKAKVVAAKAKAKQKKEAAKQKEKQQQAAAMAK